MQEILVVHEALVHAAAIKEVCQGFANPNVVVRRAAHVHREALKTNGVGIENLLFDDPVLVEFFAARLVDPAVRGIDGEDVDVAFAEGGVGILAFGEKAEAVLNAIAGHHGDIPATTPYTPIVMAADAISSARPGARRESMEMYVKRLEQLEALAKEQKGVSESYAIQAGREVRVIVDAKSISDGEAFAMSKRIAARIEEEMTFPGEIKVTVLREVRAEAIAH